MSKDCLTFLVKETKEITINESPFKKPKVIKVYSFLNLYSKKLSFVSK